MERKRKRRRRVRRGVSPVLVLILAVLLIVAVKSCRSAGKAEETQPPTEVMETVDPEVAKAEKAAKILSGEIQYETAEETVRTYAELVGVSYSDYPASLIELLDKNRETLEFVLRYPFREEPQTPADVSEYDLSEGVPLFMQWDSRWGYIKYGADVAGITACGPTCLAMAGYYVTGNPKFTPDQMMEFSVQNGYCSEGSGTPWTFISVGGPSLGLKVTEIPLDENRILRNLEAGNPIICNMGPGLFTTTGHYIVMVGCEDGKIRINDSNSYANSAKLWSYEEIYDQIRNLWVIQA